MPISKKIIVQINSIDSDADFKTLMINILNEEDKGNHRFKETYEKFIMDYIEKRGEDKKDD